MSTPLDSAWRNVWRAGSCDNLRAADATLGLGAGLLACCALGLAANSLAIAAVSRSAFRATGCAALLAAVCAIDIASLLATCLPMGVWRVIGQASGAAAEGNEHLCRALPYLQLSLHACQAAANCLLAAERLLRCCCRGQRHRSLAMGVAALTALVLTVLHLPMLPDTRLTVMASSSSSSSSLAAGNSSSANYSMPIQQDPTAYCLLASQSASGYSAVGLGLLAFSLQLCLPCLLATLLCLKAALAALFASRRNRGFGGGFGSSGGEMFGNFNNINSSSSIGGENSLAVGSAGTGITLAGGSSAERWGDQLALTAISVYALLHSPVILLRWLQLLANWGRLPQWGAVVSPDAVCSAQFTAGLVSILRPCLQPLMYLAVCSVFRREFQLTVCQCSRSSLQPKDSVMVMRSRQQWPSGK